MIKRLMLLTLVALLVVPALSNAKDMTGKYGLGYFSSDAPVGVRYWATPKLGIDVGIGFESIDLPFETEEGEFDSEKASSFWFEIGFPFVVVESQQANFWVRPGFQFASLDNRVYGFGDVDEKWTQMTFTLTPGAEVFFGDHFSIEAAHGIAIQMTKAPDNEEEFGAFAGESTTDIRTFADDDVFFAFHFYFK